MSDTHAPAAQYEPRGGHGYSWRPTCSCGWVCGWRYVTRDAAQAMAEAHDR